MFLHTVSQEIKKLKRQLNHRMDRTTLTLLGYLSLSTEPLLQITTEKQGQ